MSGVGTPWSLCTDETRKPQGLDSGLIESSETKAASCKVVLEQGMQHATVKRVHGNCDRNTLV